MERVIAVSWQPSCSPGDLSTASCHNRLHLVHVRDSSLLPSRQNIDRRIYDFLFGSGAHQILVAWLVVHDLHLLHELGTSLSCESPLPWQICAHAQHFGEIV